MAANARTNASTKRVPMDPLRKTALVAGILYLITFIASIPAVFLLNPVLSDPNYILGAGADRQVALGALLDLVNALAGIGSAVALYSVVRRQHEGLAIGIITTRIYEGAVILVGVISILAVITLRQVGAAEGDAASLVPVGRGLIAVRDWTFILGPSLAPGLNALVLGTLMYRSGLVPRLIPALGLVGGPLILSSAIGTILGINQLVSAWSGLATVPIFLWELSLGLWMVFKGFRKEAPIMIEAAAEAAAEASPSRSSIGVASPAGAA